MIKIDQKSFTSEDYVSDHQSIRRRNFKFRKEFPLKTRFFTKLFPNPFFIYIYLIRECELHYSLHYVPILTTKNIRCIECSVLANKEPFGSHICKVFFLSKGKWRCGQLWTVFQFKLFSLLGRI